MFHSPGASRGIGAACALEFARNGTSLLLHGRDGRVLEQVAQQCEALNKHESDLPKVIQINSKVKIFMAMMSDLSSRIAYKSFLVQVEIIPLLFLTLFLNSLCLAIWLPFPIGKQNLI
jgi:NAD(P)-dependent dehydrogenase (short-subunit alcohol dehydrogenase family)